MTLVTIVILVVWSTGGGIAGAEVTFEPAMTGLTGGECTTDAAGRCTISVQAPVDTETLGGTLVVTSPGGTTSRRPFFWRGGQGQVGPVEFSLNAAGGVERRTGIESTPAPPTPPTPTAVVIVDPTGDGGALATPTVIPPPTTPTEEPQTSREAPEPTGRATATLTVETGITQSPHITTTPQVTVPPESEGAGSLTSTVLLLAALVLFAIAVFWFISLIRPERS